MSKALVYLCIRKSENACLCARWILANERAASLLAEDAWYARESREFRFRSNAVRNLNATYSYFTQGFQNFWPQNFCVIENEKKLFRTLLTNYLCVSSRTYFLQVNYIAVGPCQCASTQGFIQFYKAEGHRQSKRVNAIIVTIKATTNGNCSEITVRSRLANWNSIRSWPRSLQNNLAHREIRRIYLLAKIRNEAKKQDAESSHLMLTSKCEM